MPTVSHKNALEKKREKILALDCDTLSGFSIDLVAGLK